MKRVFHLGINGAAVEVLTPAHKTLLMVHVTRVLRQLAGLSVTPYRSDQGNASMRESG